MGEHGREMRKHETITDEKKEKPIKNKDGKKGKTERKKDEKGKNEKR